MGRTDYLKQQLTESHATAWLLPANPNEEQIDTTRQAYERTAEKFNHNENMISEFWKWCDARDRLKA